jgi:L-ascorbate metabolism protein UlaG (beta-lactamase superfamily)
MEISYLGHSCFRIRGRDTAIVTDPFSPKYGYTMGKPQAGIVTVSARDGSDLDNHAFIGGVGGEPRIIDGPGEYEIANVLINGIRTASKPENGNDTGWRLNTAFVIDIDDLRICHLGDLVNVLTADQVEAIGAVSVLMVPVGGGETIGAKTAVEVISQIEPSVVIPMHYQLEGTKLEGLEPVSRFLNEMGAKSATPVPKLSLTSKSSLPADMQVTVLENKRG